MSRIAQQLDKIRQRIQQSADHAGRQASEITLLAVSKTRPVSDIRAALEAGQTRFGESYLQEAQAKIQELAGTDIEWHFIGRCQSNKTSSIAELFDWVHGIDRLKIAQRLSQQRPGDKPLNVCIQVNLSDEASKAGIRPDEVQALAVAIKDLPNLRLRGLMALPAVEQEVTHQRQSFARLRGLMEDLNKQGLQLDTLSMGMSNDLEAAIMEGATIVRIGTDIFGPR